MFSSVDEKAIRKANVFRVFVNFNRGMIEDALSDFGVKTSNNRNKMEVKLIDLFTAESLERWYSKWLKEFPCPICTGIPKFVVTADPKDIESFSVRLECSHDGKKIKTKECASAYEAIHEWIIENSKMVMELQKSGMPDEDIQKLYDDAVAKETARLNNLRRRGV